MHNVSTKKESVEQITASTIKSIFEVQFSSFSNTILTHLDSISFTLALFDTKLKNFEIDNEKTKQKLLSLKSLDKETQDGDSVTSESVISELEDRRKRAFNIMAFNVEEPKVVLINE